MLLGGLYLCFEGFEKIFETFFKKENPISEKNDIHLESYHRRNTTSFKKNL